MEKVYYNLEINSANSQEIKNQIGTGECLNNNIYQYKIVDTGPNLDIEEEYVVEHYLNILDKKINLLQAIDKDLSITLWITYEYISQCNFEFPPILLKRMSDLNIHLCISAYQYNDNQDDWTIIEMDN